MFKPKGGGNDQIMLESKLMKIKHMILGADHGDTLTKENRQTPQPGKVKGGVICTSLL
jgi:hypothetical protein